MKNMFFIHSFLYILISVTGVVAVPLGSLLFEALGGTATVRSRGVAHLFVPSRVIII